MFSRTPITKSTETYWRQIKKLNNELEAADAVIIGAGPVFPLRQALFTTERDSIDTLGILKKKYGFHDMYTGGFYPFATLRNTGHTGAVLSITIATLIHQNLLIRTCFHW